MFKKFLFLLLSLALLLSGTYFASASQPDGTDIYPPNFVSAAIDIIQEDWQDSYFSEITMTIGEDNLTIDGREAVAAPVTIENGELILPISDIAQAIGSESLIDERASGPEDVGSDARMATSGRRSHGQGKRHATKDETEQTLNVRVHRKGNRISITKPYQTRELIVQTNDKTRLKDTYGAARAIDNGSGLHLLQYTSEESAQHAHIMLERNRNVEFVEPNSVLTIGETTATNAVAAMQTKNVLVDRWGSERIAADRFIAYLEANNKTSNNLLVAVIDTGVDHTHPFLQGRVLTELGYNFYSDNKNAMDDQSHGSHVSGTIVDCTPANVKIIPVKALSSGGFGTTMNIVFGIRYAAEKGAKVINMSLGGPSTSETYLMKDAADYAVGLGTAIVVCAGNESDNVIYYSPACFDNVITVAASDLDDSPASFSNYGSAIDIAAPGVDILSCIPGGVFDHYNGTSMATPHVAAAVAMLRLDNPAATPAQLTQAVKNLGNNTHSNNFGAGILDLNLFFGAAIPEPPGLRLSKRVINIDTMEKKYRFHQLRTRITPLSTPNKSVTYTSSNPQVATVTASGRIDIVNLGVATITATLVGTGYKDDCVVTVTMDDSPFWFGSAASSYASGRGTRENPYMISTAEQLARLARNSFSATMATPQAGIQGHEYYELTADIDLAGKEWISIGYNNWNFNGNFNGNGHVIKNMRQGYINTGLPRSASGLFNHIGGRVLNLGVVNADQRGLEDTGILSSYVSGIIENCYTSGKTTGSGFIHSAARSGNYPFFSGYYDPPVIKNCYSTAQAPKGFIFSSMGAQISNCYSYGNISSPNGIACYITNVGSDGQNAGSTIRNSFAINTNAAGFTYFAGEKTGSAASVSTINRCYGYASNFMGVMSDYNPSGTDVSSRPLAFFKDRNNYTTLANWNSASPWDFSNTWAIDADYNDGLPYLKVFGRDEGPSAELDVTPLSWAPSSDMEIAGIVVITSISWTALSSAPSWLTITPTSGTGGAILTMFAYENTGAASRTGTITISGGGITKVVTVTQAGAEGLPSLEVSQTSWAPLSPAANTTVSITSSGSWTASSNATSWLTVSPSNGLGSGTLTLNATANTGPANRTGTITIVGSGITETITVIQAGTTDLPSLEVSQTSWAPLSSAANTTVSITSIGPWIASSSASSWLTVSPSSGLSSGMLTLSVTANTGSATRNGTITVFGGGTTKTITVIQAGGASSQSTLDVSRTSWSPPSLAGGTTAKITSNVSWTASSNASSWLTVSPSSRTGDGTIFIDVTANTGPTRTGTITVTGGGITRTISVTQTGTAAPSTLDVSRTSWAALSSASNITASITSNVSWTASSNASSWLTVSPSSGTGNGTITLNATANTGTANRSGTITVTGGGITKSITVIQAGAVAQSTLDVSRTSWAALSSASNINVSVTSNVSWTASSNASSWLTVSPSSGTGNGTITLNATANTGTANRSGTITVTGGGITKSITVIQAGGAAAQSTLNVSRTSWAPPALAGSTSAQITSNVSWTASSNATSWLTVSPSSGTGNGTIFIDVKANTGSARTGTITVSGGGITRTISVTQAGTTVQSSLEVARTSWTPTSSAANTNVSITSNVSWSASSSASSWLTVSPSSGSGNGSITLNVTANTSTTSRSGTITVSGGGITKSITVVQAAGAAAPSTTLDVGKTSWSPPSFAGGTNAKITSNVSWTASSNASWLTVSPSSGTGNGTIFIDVSENTGSTRTGTITVTGGGITKTITVTQSAPQP